PFWLAESQEARMYTVGFALLTGAAWALMWAWDQLTIPARRPPVGRLVLFALLSALALATHYNAVFILLAWYGWWGIWALLRTDRWRQLSTLFLTGLGTLLLLLPLAPIALPQITDYATPISSRHRLPYI
ncbi:MAG: hypothetical protein HC802_04470, partial [Caldilineaceae bacterium]|nr:hypothetical protein [Caldilineaceae bacterium]